MWGYLDGVIPAAQTEMVSNHIATCVDCAAHFDFAAEFLHAVARTSKREPATDALRDRVLAALTDEAASRTPKS